MSRDTPEKKATFAAYMREFRKRPGELEKETARKKAWIARNPEKHRESRRRSACKRRLILMADPSIQKGVRVRFNHAISLEEYESKLRSQNNVCYLCNKPFTEKNGPVLDHNHVTSQLRDFIHRTCNLAIGNLEDDFEMCDKAAMYLRRWHQEI
jgi:hypothetical protein